MSNLIKLNKYYLKNRMIGSDIDNNYISLQIGGGNTGVESNLELYIPQFAGDSSDIWPLITKNWKENKSLGIRSTSNPELINFLFVPNKHGKIDEPILGRGTFTAVYELKNNHNKSDSTKYILRLYMRDENLSKEHMMHIEKIKNEYKLYEKYLINVYYYGELKIVDQKFKFYNNTDKYKFEPNTKKTYNFDHVITKIYNTPEFDKSYNVIGLNNIKKYLFLYNNIVMLSDLEKNKSFHADYKIGNVGWEDPNTMGVVLIDYDTDTIQHLDKLNQKIGIENGYVTSIRFPSTYIPEYIKNGNGIKSVPFEQYIKYSIGGLYNIIQVLNIEFTQFEIILPSNLINNQKIKKINTKKFGASLNLLSKNYNDIPEYDEMLAILSWLYLNNKLVR